MLVFYDLHLFFWCFGFPFLEYFLYINWEIFYNFAVFPPPPSKCIPTAAAPPLLQAVNDRGLPPLSPRLCSHALAAAAANILQLNLVTTITTTTAALPTCTTPTTIATTTTATTTTISLIITTPLYLPPHA